MSRKKYAIATLVFGPRTLYRTMAKILFDSLGRQGLLTLAEPILLTTEELDPAEFARWDVRVVKVPERAYPRRYNGPLPAMLHKLECFGLQEYQKVLFCDADAYAWSADPLLFQLPTPTFLIEGSVPLAAGNMLVQPDPAVYADLVQLGLTGQYDPKTGWNNCGPAPPWPKWHSQMFAPQFCHIVSPLIREHTWNFFYAGAEQGLLYYYFNYCRPGYLCYHFPAFFHLSGQERAEILLGDAQHFYWTIAQDAGLKDELREACTSDVAFRRSPLYTGS